LIPAELKRLSGASGGRIPLAIGRRPAQSNGMAIAELRIMQFLAAFDAMKRRGTGEKTL
jgi:hypothetical protein